MENFVSADTARIGERFQPMVAAFGTPEVMIAECKASLLNPTFRYYGKLIAEAEYETEGFYTLWGALRWARRMRVQYGCAIHRLYWYAIPNVWTERLRRSEKRRIPPRAAAFSGLAEW
jgi:hypothetical protein